MAPSGLQSPSDTPMPAGGSAPGPGPAQLAGMRPGGEGGPEETPQPEQPGSPSGGMTAMLGAALQTVQKTELQLTQLARQFPAAGSALGEARDAIRKAIDPLRAATRQILLNPGQPEPPAPSVGG